MFDHTSISSTLEEVEMSQLWSTERGRPAHACKVYKYTSPDDTRVKPLHGGKHGESDDFIITPVVLLHTKCDTGICTKQTKKKIKEK